MLGSRDTDEGLTVTDIDRVANTLRDRIHSGELAPDTVLPTAAALAAEKEMATGTVANAYRRLAEEGLVVSRPRKGTIVVGPFRPIVRSTGDDTGAGRARHESVVVGLEEVPSWASELVSAVGEPVLRRRSVLVCRNRVVGRAIACYPASLASGALMATDPGPGGVSARLAEAGRARIRAEESLAWRPADADDNDELDLWRTDGIVEVTRKGFDANNDLVEVVRLDLVAAAWHLVYPISRA
jgi:GntR family transcriptional regulator